MKKLFLTITLLAFFGVIHAQVSFKPGIKAGLNLSKFTNSDSTNKTDFYVGGLFAIKLAKFYTLQPELIYSRQGAIRKEVSTGFFSSTKNVRYDLDYLSLGIINKFTFGKGFQVVVGPTVDFKLNDNFSSNYAEDPIGLDIAFEGGLGYTFNNLTFEIRLKQGLIDIFGDYDESNDTNENGNYDEVVLNQVFQIGLAYTFNLKK